MFAGGISEESGWQSFSSGQQDSSKYSSRSQQCCSLDGLDSTSDFQFLQSLLQTLKDYSECTDYNWYYLHLHVPQLFKFFGKIQVFFNHFTFFFPLQGPPEQQNPLEDKFSFSFLFFIVLLINIWFDLLAGIRWFVFISKSQRISCVSFPRTDYGLCIYHLVRMIKF